MNGAQIHLRRAALAGLALFLAACTTPVEEALQRETAETQLGLAAAYVEQRDSRQALQAVQRALELEPKNVNAFLILGRIHHQDRRWDQALDAYRQALALDPKRPEIYYLMAAVVYEKRDAQGAIELLRKALAQPMYLNPEHAHLALGRIYLDQAQVDEALGEFRKAVDLQPELALAQNALGYALLLKGRYDESIEALSRAVRFAPTMVEAHQNLGIAYFKAGKRDDARAAFRRMIEVAPPDSPLIEWGKRALAEVGGEGTLPSSSSAGQSGPSAFGPGGAPAAATSAPSVRSGTPQGPGTQ